MKPKAAEMEKEGSGIRKGILSHENCARVCVEDHGMAV